jgi:hypothetical protein
MRETCQAAIVSIVRAGVRGVGSGLLGVAISTSFACSLVTSLDGLSTGTGASTRNEDAAATEDAGSAVSGSGDDGGSVSVPGEDAGVADATSSAIDSPVALKDASLPLDASVDAPLDAPIDTTSPCTGGEISCNGSCINPASDPANCNGCGNVCSSGLCGSNLAAPMTSLPSGWTFNGTANYDTSAPSAELTKASVPDSAGTFLYSHPIALDSMTAQFQFRIGLQGGSRCDGMGFVLEQNGPSAVGASGSGLGMAGLEGFGVELDIYNNAVCGDTSGDHVGVDELSVCPADNGTPTSLFESDVSSVVDLGDTHWHTAVVTLVSGAVSLSIDGTSVINNVALSGLELGAPYYLGFAAGTGGLVAPDGGPGGYRHEVKNVTITFPTPRCL